MVPTSLEQLLARRRSLLLQGPMGPFFERLAATLRAQGQAVWKVNFNGGDDLFYRDEQVFRFHQPAKLFPGWLGELLDDLQADTIVLFGQSREMHDMAIQLARTRGIAVFVFEEGYVRPDYVTLEAGGVNAASAIPRDPAFYRALVPEATPTPLPTNQQFRTVADMAMRYAMACWDERATYPHYVHHRSLAPVREGLKWVRGAWRKWHYRLAERAMMDKLTAPERHKRFFLAPLQVWNDSQIRLHSPYRDVGAFIHAVVESFAAHAPADQWLVFKHHPLDRPYCDYALQIACESAHWGIADRVLYIHDQHLPTLLQHARGVVTVNSTTGLQALFHGTPVTTLGDAFYAVTDLVHPGPLSSFWQDPGSVDADLFRRFRGHLIRETQLNASFYADTPGLPLAAWPAAAASANTEVKRRLASASGSPRLAAQAANWSSPTRPTLK